jgi:carbamoyltransferase
MKHSMTGSAGDRQAAHVVLGVHFGHDANAAILIDGRIVADVAEERFTRCKHSHDVPFNAVEYCLAAAGIGIDAVDEIALGGLRQNHGLRALFGIAHPGPNDPQAALPPLVTPSYHRRFFPARTPRVTFVEHHLAHAATAYFTVRESGRVLIATVDGTGDGASTCLWRGENGRIEPLVKLDENASLGWFYSNVTEAIGLWHGDGEGTTMGLAPYGDPSRCRGALDGHYPVFSRGALETPAAFKGRYTHLALKSAYHWHSEEAMKLTPLVERYGKPDIAAEAQRILEEQVMEFVLPWLEREGTRTLATAGGVFLNVKLNQRLWMSGCIDRHHPYPNPGDSSLGLGAALWAAADQGVAIEPIRDLYHGPAYGNDEIEALLKARSLPYRRSDDIAGDVAEYLAEDRVVAWLEGRMESGPRALGHRSILVSPGRAEHKDIVNSKVKFREAFRPFCPSILSEAKDELLMKPRDERYMITSFDCAPSWRDRLPAVVHVDGTLRPQTVEREIEPLYWRLIDEFRKRTGLPAVLNTSLNIKGEPMICHPREAIRCFYDSGIDVLAMGDLILTK